MICTRNMSQLGEAARRRWVVLRNRQTDEDYDAADGDINRAFANIYHTIAAERKGKRVLVEQFVVLAPDTEAALNLLTKGDGAGDVCAEIRVTPGVTRLVVATVGPSRWMSSGDSVCNALREAFAMRPLDPVAALDSLDRILDDRLVLLVAGSNFSTWTATFELPDGTPCGVPPGTGGAPVVAVLEACKNYYALTYELSYHVLK